MKFIQRFITLKMSILRVDAAIIKRKKVKPNLYPSIHYGEVLFCDILTFYDINAKSIKEKFLG